MAKPRVFISSTFYDLRHIRSSLEQFVEALGYEAVLSEKGRIAFDPSLPLDESCYREVRNSDILVLIVGGRYGSMASEEGTETSEDFFDRYSSITRKEYEAAVERDIPVYILVDREVYTEYETFKKNRSVENITYVQVDSVNVFLLIDQILGQARNNPLHQFEHQSEITSWLREQWGGLFKEMLAGRSEQRQLSSLDDQVKGLSEINTTLKRYLEEIVSRVSESGEAEELIESEDQRLAESRRMQEFSKHPWVQTMVERYEETDLEGAKRLFSEATSIEDIALAVVKLSPETSDIHKLLKMWQETQIEKGDGTSFGEFHINNAREILGLPRLGYSGSLQQKKATGKK